MLPIVRLEANDGRLVASGGFENIVAPGVCFYATSAFLDKRGKDEDGQLFLTDARVVFLGSALTAVPWSKVATFRRDGSSLMLQRNDRQTPYRYVMGGIGEAMKAEFIGQQLFAVGVR